MHGTGQRLVVDPRTAYARTECRHYIFSLHHLKQLQKIARIILQVPILHYHTPAARLRYAALDRFGFIIIVALMWLNVLDLVLWPLVSAVLRLLV